MKEYKAWTKSYWKGSDEEHTFYDEEVLVKFVNEHKNNIVGLCEVNYTNLMGKYIPESVTMKRYLVSINEYANDPYGDSYLNKQYLEFIYANDEKGAKKKALDEVKSKHSELPYHYEAVDCKLRPLENEDF